MHGAKVNTQCKSYFIVNDKFHKTHIIIGSVKDTSPESLVFGTGALSSFTSFVSSTEGL
jgi:hypothetical protein